VLQAVKGRLDSLLQTWHLVMTVYQLGKQSKQEFNLSYNKEEPSTNVLDLHGF
jgi:hypothetical protein